MELGGAQYAVPADLAAEIAKMLESKGLKPANGKKPEDMQAALDAVKADARRQIDALQAKVDGLQNANAHKALRDKIALEIREDMAVSELAKRFDCAVSESDSTDAKRRKIVAKLDASIKLDGKSIEYVSGIMEGLVQARGDEAAASPRVGTAKLDATQTSDDPAESARADMIKHYNELHKKGGK